MGQRTSWALLGGAAYSDADNATGLDTVGEKAKVPDSVVQPGKQDVGDDQ